MQVLSWKYQHLKYESIEDSIFIESQKMHLFFTKNYMMPEIKYNLKARSQSLKITMEKIKIMGKVIFSAAVKNHLLNRCADAERGVLFSEP